MSGIQNIQLGSLAATRLPALVQPKAEAGGSFQDALLQAIGEVNQMQQDADQAVEALHTGGDVNPAEVLTAVQKADLAFRMMMQVRNKLVEAYQEVKEIRV